MDRETVELARQLCCQAGIIMEDCSPAAVASPTDPEKLAVTVAELMTAVDRMEALLRAADAIIR